MEALDRGGKADEVIQKGFSGEATACQFVMEKYDMDASDSCVCLRRQQ